MTHDQVMALWTFGALHIPQFLSRESARSLRKEVERIMADKKLMCEPSERFNREFNANSSTYVDQHKKSRYLMKLIELIKTMANQMFHGRAVFHMSLIQCNESGRE